MLALAFHKSGYLNQDGVEMVIFKYLSRRLREEYTSGATPKAK